jgi:hypothetical protein
VVDVERSLGHRYGLIVNGPDRLGVGCFHHGNSVGNAVERVVDSVVVLSVVVRVVLVVVVVVVGVIVMAAIVDVV